MIGCFPFLCSVVLQTIALLPPTGLVACLQTKDRKRYYRRVVTYHSTLLVAFNYVFVLFFQIWNEAIVWMFYIFSSSLCHVSTFSLWSTELTPYPSSSSGSSSVFPSPHHPYFFFLLLSFHSIYWSDTVTCRLPGGCLGTSDRLPGGGGVKWRRGGWFHLIKYQYFTPLIQWRLTKHDTISSKLADVCGSASTVSSCFGDRRRDRGAVPLLWQTMKWWAKWFCIPRLQTSGKHDVEPQMSSTIRDSLLFLF